MFKHRIVVFVAFFAATVVVVFALVFHTVHFDNNNNVFLLLIILFSITFLLIAYFLNRHIYKRIEALYTLIHSLGSNKFIEGQVEFDTIEEDVLKWSQAKMPLIQQLKAQEKFRREFIGDVAHELKTPIFNIQGYVCTLIDGGLDDERINRKYLRKAYKNINRMIYMVQDLDLITKLESGELVVNKGRFSLTQLIEDAVEEVEMRAMEKDIEICFHRTDEELWAYAEKNHILRVLINLLSNSIKYGKQGGRTEIYVSQKMTTNKYYIKIKDTGIGLKKDDLPRIFERFFRVDKSRSRVVGGSGLGLAIVKHILEVHGESISVESVFGEGTSFYFTIQKNN